MQSESPFTALSVPLAKSSPNFSPRKPIEDAIRNKKLNKEPSRFEQSMRRWYTGKLNHERAAWNSIISMSQLVSLFRRGEQILRPRPYGLPGYSVRPIQQADTTHQTAMNIMTFHSQISESKLMAVNPTVNMRPGDDTPEAIAAAQACRPVVDYYESQWYTAKFSRREAIRLLTDGMFIHQVRWNPFKGEMQVPSREVSRQEITIDPGEGRCADCNYEAEANEFEPVDFGYQCPQCQSQAVDVRQAVKDSIAQIGMGQPKAVGEPEIISSALAQWRWELSKDLEESPWAIKRQRITQGIVNLMLGDITIPDSGSSDDYGLDILHALAYSGQAFQGAVNNSRYGGGDSYADNQTRPTMAEAWLSPEDQAEIECEEGDTVCGMTMPKGRLSNFFQGKPICVVGLNDMALIIGVYANESQKQEVVTAHWFMDAESGAGRGMEDTAGVQKRFNAVDGQIYQGLATTATPPVFTDMRIVKEDDGQYLFKPGVNHDLNLSMLPPGMKIQDAIYMPSPGAVSPQYIQYGTVFLKQMADLSSLAVEFSDLLSIDNRTATGAQISAALANSLYGPMLLSKGESRVEIAKKIVKLQACYGVVDRYFPGKGNARGRQVSGGALKGQVIFELEENSHLPVTPYSQQSDTTSLFTAFGGAEVAYKISKEDPEWFRMATRPFQGFKFEVESQDDLSTLCLTRLDSMREQFRDGTDDPAMLVEMVQPPISSIEPKLMEQANWFASYLHLQAGQKLQSVLRAAVEAIYWKLTNLDAQKQMPQAANAGLIQGIGAAAAAAPTALGGMALQQQMPQPQGDDPSLEIEAEHALAEDDHRTELQLKRMEGQNQLAVTREQGKNAAETTRIAGENAVKVAKAKPRPKPTKAA